MGSEITSRELKDNAGGGISKNVITGETLQVNQKNVEDLNLKNIVNIYLTSNYGYALNLDGDDRRYFIWDIPDEALEAARGKEWFKVAYKYFRTTRQIGLAVSPAASVHR